MDDEGSFTGEGLEELAGGPRDVVRRNRAGGEAERLRQRRGRRPATLVRAEQPREPVERLIDRIRVQDRSRVLEHLAQRPVGDALAVRQAPAAQDGRVGCDRRQQLGDEPRLAHSRFARDDDESRVTLGDYLVEAPAQHRKLLLPADDGDVGAGRPRRRGAPYGDEAAGRNRLGLALRGERLDRLGLDLATHEAIGGLPHERLAGTRVLLQAGRDVDSVAGDDHLPRPAAAGGDDLARVHTDADRKAAPETSLELGVQLADARLDVRGRPDCADRIVLMRDRDSENRHHGITDELLHRSPVALDRLPGLLEVAPHDFAHGLCVRLFAERGRGGDVAEEERDELAPLGPRRRERLAAAGAEAGVLRVLPAALRTYSHPGKGTPQTARVQVRRAQQGGGPAVQPNTRPNSDIRTRRPRSASTPTCSTAPATRTRHATPATPEGARRGRPVRNAAGGQCDGRAPLPTPARLALLADRINTGDSPRQLGPSVRLRTPPTCPYRTMTIRSRTSTTRTIRTINLRATTYGVR